MVLKGDVILRLSKENVPFYLLKKEKNEANPNGLMFAGMLIAARKKETTPEIETSPKLTPNMPEQ